MSIRNNCLCFIIFLLLFSCGNQSGKINEATQKVPITENLSSPGIVFIRDLHNFGTLKAGEIVSFSFVFINNGKTPVKINKVDSDCGCIKINYDKGEIGHGQKSAIEVIFNTSGEWGNQLKTIRAETSAGEIKELTISAYIENEIFNKLLNPKK